MTIWTSSMQMIYERVAGNEVMLDEFMDNLSANSAHLRGVSALCAVQQDGRQ
jgi:hypothetical protein